MLEVYIDAASAGNPGKSGIGIFIKGEGHHVKISEPIGVTDNHHAEFQALVRALQEVQPLAPSIVSVRSDSKIVVTSIEKRYVKKESYRLLLDEALEIIDTFPLFFIKWIPDDKNKAADALAREAIRKQ
ncbi:reverse transcriptase-like protein [Kurthia massiliensis]|uniref:reverse transcriptase-like protein n=1 Tax=Kurthia massiliensis TaxID=1033739 RepID=UPI0002881C4A|nr:reverse transcriptase-like protein [Kurthia massiliensis]